MVEIIEHSEMAMVFGDEPNSEIPELIGMNVIRHHDHFEIDIKDVPELRKRLENANICDNCASEYDFMGQCNCEH